jgi:hypothetical protein
MTNTENKFLASFLQRLADMLSYESCNDMLLTDTPEHREFLLGLQQARFADDPTAYESAEDAATVRTCKWNKDQPACLVTFNTVVVRHLLNRFMRENGITRADLYDRENW